MSQEEQNLEAVEKWKNLFNTDLSAMVSDSYTRDCVVHYMGLSTVEGSDAFLKVEQEVIAAIPDRAFRIDHTHATGDMVIVEAILTFTNADGEYIETPFCGVLTFKDGKIATDRTYLDYGKIPGL